MLSGYPLVSDVLSEDGYLYSGLEKEVNEEANGSCVGPYVYDDNDINFGIDGFGNGDYDDDYDWHYNDHDEHEAAEKEHDQTFFGCSVAEDFGIDEKVMGGFGNCDYDFGALKSELIEEVDDDDFSDAFFGCSVTNEIDIDEKAMDGFGNFDFDFGALNSEIIDEVDDDDFSDAFFGCSVTDDIDIDESAMDGFGNFDFEALPMNSELIEEVAFDDFSDPFIGDCDLDFRMNLCDAQAPVCLPLTEGAPFEIVDTSLSIGDELRLGYDMVVLCASKEALSESLPSGERLMSLVARDSLTVRDLENIAQKHKGWIGTLEHVTDNSIHSWTQSPVNGATLLNFAKICDVIYFCVRPPPSEPHTLQYIRTALPQCSYIARGEECKVHKDLANYHFTEDAKAHMETYSHSSIPLVACRYGVQCTAYQRIQHGEQKLEDCGHVQVYSHLCSATTMTSIMSPFVVDSLATESVDKAIDGVLTANIHIDEVEKLAKSRMSAKGPLQALIDEVVTNGFSAVLKLPDSDVSLLTTVDTTLSHSRHIEMGSPLQNCHMLALLLYTGCDCTYDLTKSQNNGDYLKWAVWDKLLREALKRMETVTVRLAPVYSGVKGVELKGDVCFGVLRTFVSASLDRNKAIAFKRSYGMLLGFEVPRVRSGASELQPTDTRGVDVSWLSKFPDEKEVLFSRESGYFSMRQESKSGDTQSVRVAFCADNSNSRLFC